MKLYFINKFLGDIDNINVEGLWMYGEIIPTINIEEFHNFLARIVEESNLEVLEVLEVLEEDKYSEMLDDKNWFILDDENNKKGIYIPAIYSNGEISWRWR